MEEQKIKKLRMVINENLRVQRGGADPVPYIDVANVLSDIAARQNHAVFGRRGCGKSLLLHYSAKNLPVTIKPIYLNCEDFKKHSFPNVLIEILDALFGELEKHLTGWFGRKKRSRGLISEIRKELNGMREKADRLEKDVRQSDTLAVADEQKGQLCFGLPGVASGLTESIQECEKREVEQRFKVSDDKIRELDTWLPRLKTQIREFFEISTTVKAVFLQVDDFYHLRRADQPLVIDYIHRLCKDLPLYFKLATLRHCSTLYADRKGQPIGAQERHDYQPINIDFSLADFRRTVDQNRKILREFGNLAGIDGKEIDDLFKGAGFERLVLAGGGVPRDCLSLFLEVLVHVQHNPDNDRRIGKDDVRILSRANFERRIEELKQDSEGAEQGILIKGIYVIRQFCIERKTNLIMVPESVLQQNDSMRALLNRLLDYRIIHTAGTAITHKSQPGTYHAMAIDIGCYAHMRVLDKKFNEIDLSNAEAKERMRSAPILDEKVLSSLWASAPRDIDAAIKAQDD
ncbi:MAG: hypothetical protein NT002_07215 [candidate division Zixibacteria bacterium]|nr:hypothetical protein [candidate division Zixibacteria bacterium]